MPIRVKRDFEEFSKDLNILVTRKVWETPENSGRLRDCRRLMKTAYNDLEINTLVEVLIVFSIYHANNFGSRSIKEGRKVATLKSKSTLYTIYTNGLRHGRSIQKLQNAIFFKIIEIPFNV